MTQSRGGSCLSPKALERLRVSGYIFREKLESDKATEFDVFGLVDDSHTAAAQLLDDAIVRDGLADHADAMLGALQWEVNESNGLFRNPERFRVPGF